MNFELIDRLSELSTDRIVGYKSVSLAEEYLKDHFPTFPVLPGVLMLEAMTQAARWLILHRTDFATSMVVLKEARNVRYGQFVAPGRTLRLEVEYLKPTDAGHSVKAAGFLEDQQAVSGRFELACFNLAASDPSQAQVDRNVTAYSRGRLALLTTHTPDLRL